MLYPLSYWGVGFVVARVYANSMARCSALPFLGAGRANVGGTRRVPPPGKTVCTQKRKNPMFFFT